TGDGSRKPSSLPCSCAVRCPPYLTGFDPGDDGGVAEAAASDADLALEANRFADAVPENRLAAGSGSPDIDPSLFGVSPFRHCHGPRSDPTWGPWPSSARSTAHVRRSAASSMPLSALTWRPFSAKRLTVPTVPACPSSWSRSS